MLVPRSPTSSPYYCSQGKGRHVDVTTTGGTSVQCPERYANNKIWNTIKTLRGHLLQERLAKDAGRLALCDEQQNTNHTLDQLEELVECVDDNEDRLVVDSAVDTKTIFDLLLKYNSAIPSSINIIPLQYSLQLKKSIDISLQHPRIQLLNKSTSGINKEHQIISEHKSQDSIADKKIISWRPATEFHSPSESPHPISPKGPFKGTAAVSGRRYRWEKHKHDAAVEKLYGKSIKKLTATTKMKHGCRKASGKMKGSEANESIQTNHYNQFAAEKKTQNKSTENKNRNKKYAPLQRHSFLRAKGEHQTVYSPSNYYLNDDDDDNDNDGCSPNIHTSQTLFDRSKELIYFEFERKRNRGIGIIDELLANMTYTSSDYSLSILNEASDYLGNLYRRKGMFPHLSDLEIFLLYLYCVGGCQLFNSLEMRNEITKALVTVDPFLCLKWACSITSLIAVTSKKLMSARIVKISAPVPASVIQSEFLFCQVARSITKSLASGIAVNFLIKTDVGLPVSCFSHRDNDWLLPFLTAMQVTEVIPSTRQGCELNVKAVICNRDDHQNNIIEIAAKDIRKQCNWLNRKHEMRTGIRTIEMTSEMINSFMIRVVVVLKEVVKSESSSRDQLVEHFNSGKREFLTRGWSGTALRVQSLCPTVNIIAVMIFDALGDQIQTSINPKHIPLSRKLRVASILIHLSSTYNTRSSQCDVIVFGNSNGVFSSLRTVRVQKNTDRVFVDLSGHGRNGLP